MSGHRRRRGAGWRSAAFRISVAAVSVGLAAQWALGQGHRGLDPADAASVTVAVETFSPADDLSYEPVPVGDALLSRVNRGAHSSPDFDLVTSTDGGRMWTTVALPEKPPETDDLVIRDLGASVVVTAERPWPDEERSRLVWMWASADGVNWNGGAVPVPDPTTKPARVNGAQITDDGAIVVSLYASDWPEDQALRTADGGRTWTAVDCGRGCERQPERVGHLSVRLDGHVSLDDGETWQFPELPGIGEDDVDNLDVVEVPGEGWFAVALVPDDDGTDTWDERFLLRSRDGLSWELVFEADSRCWTGFPGEWISTPVPYGDRFVVAYTCNNPEEPFSGPRLSQLYLLDPAGTTLTAIADTQLDGHSYGQPITLADAILVPRFEFTHGDISFLRLPMEPE